MKLTAKTTLQIQKPIGEVYEAIADPAHLTQYFIASSSGRIETGASLTWEFGDFPGAFPVAVRTVRPPESLSFVWDDATVVHIRLQAQHDGSTVVRITEGEKELSDENLAWLADNSSGWGNFLACLKAYLEYGINLRKGAFDYRNTPEPAANRAMRRLVFGITVHASPAQVENTMLGLSDPSTYRHWTSVFDPSSGYEGNWEAGSKIYFTATDEQGKRGGMVAAIETRIPHRFVSIRHCGILDGDKEITEGEEVEKWAGGMENYTFEELEGATRLTVELDAAPEFATYFNEQYPRALEKLKSLCER